MKFLRPLFLGLIVLCAAHFVLDAADDWLTWLWPSPPSSPEPSIPLSAPLSPLLAPPSQAPSPLPPPSPAQQDQREESRVNYASIFGFEKENLEFRIMPISDETYFIAFVLDKKSAEDKKDFYIKTAEEIYNLLKQLMSKEYRSSGDIAQAIYESIQPKIEVIKKENAGAENLIIALSFENYRPFLLYNYTFPSGTKLELVPVFSFGDKKGNYFSTDVNYVNNVTVLDKWSYSSGAPDRHLQYLILVNNNLYKIWKDIHSPLLFDSIFKEATTMHKVAFDLIDKTRSKRADYSKVTMMAAVINEKFGVEPSFSVQEDDKSKEKEEKREREREIAELKEQIKEKKIAQLEEQIKEREIAKLEKQIREKQIAKLEKQIREIEQGHKSREQERIVEEIQKQIGEIERSHQEKQKEKERAEQEKAREIAKLEEEIRKKEGAREIKQREREREREEQEKEKEKEIEELRKRMAEEERALKIKREEEAEKERESQERRKEIAELQKNIAGMKQERERDEKMAEVQKKINKIEQEQKEKKERESDSKRQEREIEKMRKELREMTEAIAVSRRRGWDGQQ